MTAVQRARNALSGALETRNRRDQNKSTARTALVLVAVAACVLGSLYVKKGVEVFSSPVVVDPPLDESAAAEGRNHGTRSGAVRGAPESVGEAESGMGGKGGGDGSGRADRLVPDRPSADVAVRRAGGSGGTAEGKVVTLSTSRGPIRVRLRPDLSPESVRYVRDVLASPEPCSPCSFYRAEPRGIFQGIMKKSGVEANKVLGRCLPEYLRDGDPPKRECPPHDPKCGCHGPVMTRGMIGWAGGGGGPDFFVDMYKRPANHWGNDHTVWGEVADDESLKLVDDMFDLPATVRGGMTFLDERLHFDVLSTQSGSLVAL